ncbi:MAG: hypothetical protein NPIRA06_24960 [Nitrospirales bacterium]|nr:MAG: hypothetical protein NPIRA06_24960 [Nitrospirales bacterium]
MPDDHRFTLMIVAVGGGALLVSLRTVYFKQIDVLPAELAVSQGRASSFNEAGKFNNQCGLHQTEGGNCSQI